MPPFKLSLALILAATLRVQAHDASADMGVAARNWLESLTPEQKSKANFEFGSDERTNWHFIPRDRKGLPFQEMTSEQQLLAQALLATGLSNRGYSKAVGIMSLEAVLAELEKNNKGGPARDPQRYFISIFGTPGVEPWGWRLEGHHLSLNFTAAKGEAPAMTPSFFGANPGEVKTGPRAGTRILEKEEELGRALVKSLSDDQRTKAIILAEAPKDIFDIPGRNATKAEGISWNDLTAGQRDALMILINEYLGRHRPDVAAEDLAKLKQAGLDKLCFAWAGGLERGQPHYYRVQGGSFVLEYDNVQNGANHVHSVWRDFDHDFGIDLLGEHYKASHSQ
jgi:hypothetical protein